MGWMDPLGLAERIYNDASYHGKTDNAVKSRAPTNGQLALDNSIQVKNSSPRRIGIDKINNEIVILDRTEVKPNGDEEFHGHVRCACTLDNKQTSILRKHKMLSKKGEIIK